MFLPSVHPKASSASRSCCTLLIVARSFSGNTVITPMWGIALLCCARATSGHATAAPPSSVMNFRRRGGAPPAARATRQYRLRPVRAEIPLCKALRPRSCFAGAGPQPSRYLPLRIGAGWNSIHRLLGKGLGLLFGRPLVFRKSHPFADKLTARLMLGLHIKNSKLSDDRC